MKKHAVVTGANRGIGLSLVKHYLDQGWQVTAFCRRSSAELSSSNAELIEGVNVADDNAIQHAAQRVGDQKIDLLVNNAGILSNEILGQLDFESIETQFQVNALGPLKITEALHRNFSNDAKIAMITSRMGSAADNTSGGRYGYRMSKAALNIAAVSIAHDLRDKGVAVAIIHPGLVGTDMIGGHGDVTPDQAATRIAQRIDELSLANSGSFWHANGEVLPW